MSTPAKGKGQQIALVASLVVIGGGLAAWLLLRTPALEYVQFTNGFEFPVTVKITATEGGQETTLELPPKSRKGADFEGSHTLVFTGPKGEMATRKMKFEAGDARKKRCFEYVNVLGSAAIAEDDVVYGLGIKGGRKLLSGKDHVKVCPRWGFETEKPPESITIDKNKLGMNLTHLHYVGDGDWHASITTLLAQKPDASDQARIRAWNLAVALSKQDPENPRLKALGPEFKAACGRIIDLFEGTVMAGKGKRDCLANAKNLFPGI